MAMLRSGDSGGKTGKTGLAPHPSHHSIHILQGRLSSRFMQPVYNTVVFMSIWNATQPIFRFGINVRGTFIYLAHHDSGPCLL